MRNPLLSLLPNNTNLLNVRGSLSVMEHLFRFDIQSNLYETKRGYGRESSVYTTRTTIESQTHERRRVDGRRRQLLKCHDQFRQEWKGCLSDVQMPSNAKGVVSEKVNPKGILAKRPGICICPDARLYIRHVLSPRAEGEAASP